VPYRRVSVLCLLVLAVPLASRAAAASGPSFRAHAGLDLAALEGAVSELAPDLVEGRGDVAVAAAERQQSRLFDNPTLSAAWGTLPVGTTNPAGLSRPYANVPNYAVSLGYTVPIEKREPRIRQADAAYAAERAGLLARRRTLALQLAGVLASLAADVLREAGVAGLASDAAHDLEVGQSRLRAGFATELDIDRLGLEQGRSKQRLLSAKSDVARDLGHCAALLGVACEPFADAADARAYLEQWLALAPRAAPDAQARQDLVALSEEARASQAERDLARAARIPDPTVALGYLHDRFVISGNQRNSLNVSVALPLPLFDHGQGRARAAESRRAALTEERARRLDAALATAPLLRDQLIAQRARQRELSSDVIPHAQAIVDQLEHAVENRLVPLTDLLSARRSLDELLVDEADSYADAFGALLALLAETGESPSPATETSP
jgi:cobalt-zinc-cadmium efflux system outer membrane protein